MSRRWRNRLHKALHGNIQVVVANVTALSNLRLALAGEPDEVVPQELWATRLQVEAEARLFGYAAAVGQEVPCLAAVLFRPGKGQPVKLPFKGEWDRRAAATTISLGVGYGCLVCLSLRLQWPHGGPEGRTQPDPGGGGVRVPQSWPRAVFAWRRFQC